MNMLIDVCYSGCEPEVFRSLLEYWAADVVDENGLTPLTTSATFKRWELLAILLDYGADPNLRETVFGTTALHHVAQHGHLESA